MLTNPSLAAAGARFRMACETIAQPPRDLLRLLSQEDQWRVLVDGTRNLGHQAATVLMLRRLVELTDFRGQVLVVIVDHRHKRLGRTAEKLALMFTKFDPRSIDQCVVEHGSCKDIRFVTIEQCKDLIDPVAFGFTGGADDMGMNGAAVLNVRYFVRMQPYLWDDALEMAADPYFECSRIEQPDGLHFYPSDFVPSFRQMPVALPTAAGRATKDAVWHWFREEQSFDLALRRRVHRAWSILRSRGSRCLIWPIYGLQHFSDSAQEIALTCTLLALQVAARLKVRVLLASFSPIIDLQEESTLVKALAVDLSERSTDLAGLTRALSTRHRREVDAHYSRWAIGVRRWLEGSGAFGIDLRVCSVGESGIVVDGVPGDDMHGVSMIEIGPVPLDVFHEVFASADLPPVIEGQVSANLLTQLRRDHLQLLQQATRERWRAWGAESQPDGSAELLLSLHTRPWFNQTFDPECAAALALERLSLIARITAEAPGSMAGAGEDAEGAWKSDKLGCMLLAVRELILVDQGSA